MVVPSVEVLMVAGNQVPVIPLLEVAGNAGAVLFRQRGPMASKTGVTEAAMVMDIDPGSAQAPTAGVKLYTVVPAVLVPRAVSPSVLAWRCHPGLICTARRRI